MKLLFQLQVARVLRYELRQLLQVQAYIVFSFRTIGHVINHYPIMQKVATVKV